VTPSLIASRSGPPRFTLSPPEDLLDLDEVLSPDLDFFPFFGGGSSHAQNGMNESTWIEGEGQGRTQERREW
jgi:hypothetical protein